MRPAQVNQRVQDRMMERLQLEAEQRAIMSARRREEESFQAIQQEFGMETGEIREVLALWQVRLHGSWWHRFRARRSCWTFVSKH